MRPAAESLAAPRVRHSLWRDACVNWQLHLLLLIYLLIFKYVPMWGAQIALRGLFAVSAISMTALNTPWRWRAGSRSTVVRLQRGEFWSLTKSLYSKR
ncbi:MAG: hypothetical protein OXP69_13010 [Spirochaetaceae bacterium]|nr:hypothetical protein [Spirochaetaceae bacterium]